MLGLMVIEWCPRCAEYKDRHKNRKDRERYSPCFHWENHAFTFSTQGLSVFHLGVFSRALLSQSLHSGQFTQNLLENWHSKVLWSIYFSRLQWWIMVHSHVPKYLGKQTWPFHVCPQRFPSCPIPINVPRGICLRLSDRTVWSAFICSLAELDGTWISPGSATASTAKTQAVVSVTEGWWLQSQGRNAQISTGTSGWLIHLMQWLEFSLYSPKYSWEDSLIHSRLLLTLCLRQMLGGDRRSSENNQRICVDRNNFGSRYDLTLFYIILLAFTSHIALHIASHLDLNSCCTWLMTSYEIWWGCAPMTCPKNHVLANLGTTKDNGWCCDGRQHPGGCRSGLTDFHQSSGRILNVIPKTILWKMWTFTWNDHIFWEDLFTWIYHVSMKCIVNDNW